MSWVYKQSTGELFRGETLFGVGYSGMPPKGKNNPAAQDQHNVGPIPRGWYTICTPRDSPQHGPFAMHLTPDAANQMFGRDGFLCHGDSLAHPGSASQGCIILAAPIRHAVWDSGDRRLEVVE